MRYDPIQVIAVALLVNTALLAGILFAAIAIGGH